MGPSEWGTLSKLKVGTDSLQPVLSPMGGLDSAQPRTLYGVPVYVSRHLADDGWVLDTPAPSPWSGSPSLPRLGRQRVRTGRHASPRATGRVEFASVYPATVASIASITST